MKHNIESLLQKNPAVRFMGFVNHKNNGKKVTARMFAYVLISDHAQIPHKKSLKDIYLEVFSDGYKTLDANRAEYRKEALDWLTDRMEKDAEGKVTREEIAAFLDKLYAEGELRVDTHAIFNSMEVTTDFRFNGQYMKVTSVYDADEKSGFFGWANTHTVRIANRTDNRYMTVKFNPKLDAYLPNSGKLNPNPDKLAFITTSDELKHMFASIVEFGRLGFLTYDDFLFETCKENNAETRKLCLEAERVMLGLNRVCGIRSYEHAGQLLNAGIK